ncbi:hypothetical protein H5U35_06025, partial [Candidatus Aerophobetes bacterium]|nr:hypothetical protein [Candidatus Aerophobetes bacterium]
YGHLKLTGSLVKFIFYLAAIVALGIWLSRIAKQIVVLMGWSEVVMGTFFLAAITSLPELIVSLSALKFDVNMAVGNITGSNFFDMMIIPFCDLLSPGRVFLSSVKQDHLFSGVLAVIMLNIFIVGLISRSKRCFLRVGWDAVSMILCLILGGFIFLFINS